MTASQIQRVEADLFIIPLAEVLSDAKHGDHTHFELITACSGLMMNMCAVAGLLSAVRLSMPRAALSIFCKAEASHSGSPASWRTSWPT